MRQNKKIFFAVKAFILKDDKFLAMHKPEFEEDVWELPGGRMEFGETAEDTIVREIFEETGLEIQPIRVLDTWNNIHLDYQITGITYLCSLQDGEVRLSKEHDKFTWIKADGSCISKLHKAFSKNMKKWDWDRVLKSGIAL